MKQIMFFILLLLNCTLLAGAEPEDPRRAAVLELLEVCRTVENLETTVVNMAEMQIKDMPELAPTRQILIGFYRKCFSFEALKEEIIAVYLDNFTLEELRAITAFYRTPAGKKLAERTLRISTAGMNIGRERMQKHLPALQKEIEKKLSE